jgi:microcin C transport system substrate-binding protein
MVVDVLAQSLSPGNEQRDFWTSVAADSPGSRNLMGLKSPALDALVGLVIHAPDRAALVTRSHALDRALIWQMFAVPNWNNPYVWVAYWDKFDHPRPEEPLLGFPLFTTWWYDEAKAATFEARRAAAR